MLTELLIGGAGLLAGGIGAGFLFKKKNKEVVVGNEKAFSPIEMSAEDKERLLLKYGGKEVELEFTENITVKVKDFTVVEVGVYGTKYTSIKQAVDISTVIPKEAKEDMLQADYEFRELLTERENAKRYYYVEKTAFDGDVYVYQPCKIKLDVPSRVQANLPARMAVELIRNEDKTMQLKTIYVATEDVTNASSRYEFDFNDGESQKSFAMLVATDKKYAEEMYVINQLIERLMKFNSLVSRMTFLSNGKIRIKPLSPEELAEKKRAEEAKAKAAKQEPAPAVVATPKPEPKEEAKEVVEEEFVSSSVAI